MSAFALMVDAQFEDPNLGVAALWRVGGAIPGVPVRVRLRSPEAIVPFSGNQFDLPALLIDIRLSEVADPQPGDLVQFVDEQDRVAEITEMGKIDRFGLVRTCEARYDEDPRFPTTPGR